VLILNPWVCPRFYPDIPVSSTNKADHHDITEILLKEALNTIKLKSRMVPIT
jgi:hypothetical protein